MSDDERKPLSVVSKICYGFGGVAMEMFIAVLGAYTNIFLVEVAQLPPLFGTSVIFGGRCIDAVCNFMVGPLIDRTETRWGKIKPWILGSGICLVPLYILIWYVPDVGKEGKLAYYILLYIFLMFTKTALFISTRTYVVFLSDDSQERDSATVYRSLFSLVGIISGMAIHGQIVAVYGQAQFDPCASSNGTNSTNASLQHVSLEEVKTGYLISAGIISVMTFACVLTVVIGTTERLDISKTSRQQRDQSMFKMAQAVLTFRPNVFLLLILFCVSLSLSIMLGTSVLYVQYGVDLPDQIQNVMLAFVVSAAVAMPILGKIAAKFGKRIPFICYQLALIPPALGLQFIPDRSLVLLLILCVLLGFSASAAFFMPWAMLNDIVDDYNLNTGRRLDTGFFSIALSVNSLTATLGLGLTTIALEIGGYKTGACVQPDSVGTSLGILLSVFPAASSLLSALLIWKYPITEDRRREIKEELAKRRTSVREDHIWNKDKWQENNGEGVYPRLRRTSVEEETLLSPEADLTLLVDCRETVL